MPVQAYKHLLQLKLKKDRRCKAIFSKGLGCEWPDNVTNAIILSIWMMDYHLLVCNIVVERARPNLNTITKFGNNSVLVGLVSHCNMFTKVPASWA